MWWDQDLGLYAGGGHATGGGEVARSSRSNLKFHNTYRVQLMCKTKWNIRSVLIFGIVIEMMFVNDLLPESVVVHRSLIGRWWWTTVKFWIEHRRIRMMSSSARQCRPSWTWRSRSVCCSSGYAVGTSASCPPCYTANSHQYQTYTWNKLWIWLVKGNKLELKKFSFAFIFKNTKEYVKCNKYMNTMNVCSLEFILNKYIHSSCKT